MSISQAVGGMNRYLARLVSGQAYVSARKAAERFLSSIPKLGELAKKVEVHAKGMVVPSTLFEQFGFNYIGPIDGHDLDSLVPTLKNIRELKGPQFLHIVTRKGQGYKLAEADPILYHGVSKFEPDVGIANGKSGGKVTFTQVFGDWLCDIAAQDPRVIGITPAMREGSGMVRYAEEFPDRYFDVGIAEQHAVTFAAGLACEGMKPVVAIYSTFLQRAYDQYIHDVQLQNLPVLFALDRAGLVGADGATHHGAFDLSYLRCIPNITVMVPADENECRQMLYTGITLDTPVAVRYPRGAGMGVPVQQEMRALPVGRAEVRREGRRVAILAFGPLLKPALEVGEELNATVVNMRFVKPMDDALVADLARRHDLIVTVEDNVIEGGAGSAVAESLSAQSLGARILHLGLPDRFVDHGDQGQLLAQVGLNREGILASIRARLAELPQTPAARVA
jgi:1-deoxy-D-xylulose-5-phosphate synthase